MLLNLPALWNWQAAAAAARSPPLISLQLLTVIYRKCPLTATCQALEYKLGNSNSSVAASSEGSSRDVDDHAPLDTKQEAGAELAEISLQLC